MKTPLLAVTCAALVLSGCSGLRESRLNPFNWFGQSEPQRTVAVQVDPDEERDPRPLVADVTGLVVERTPGGAIIRATGLPPTQGFWNAALVPVNADERPENGVLAYTFRLSPPRGQELQGSARSRTVTVAHFVTDFQLQGVTSIVVRGATNQRVTRR